MFTGVSQHAIDAKGRTSLPSRFREVLAASGAEKLFVTTDLFEPCLQAYAPAHWSAFTEKVAKLSQFDPNVRMLVRKFVAPAQECPVDKLGRILIPPQLREHARLSDQLIWAGSVERIEVWTPEGWAKAQADGESPEIKRELGQRLSQLL